MNFRLYLNLNEHRIRRPRANETVRTVFKKQNKQTKTKHQTCMNCRGSWEKKIRDRWKAHRTPLLN